MKVPKWDDMGLGVREGEERREKGGGEKGKVNCGFKAAFPGRKSGKPQDIGISTSVLCEPRGGSARWVDRHCWVLWAACPYNATCGIFFLSWEHSNAIGRFHI
jgi:hypothetical protein